MQNKNRLAVCPYCGRRVSYFDSLFIKNKGEYTCKRCGCITNIGLDRSIYAVTSITCVLALLLVVLYLFFGDLTNLWGVLLVIIPFLIYYCIVPFFLVLVPTSDKSFAKKVMDKKMTNTQSIFLEAQRQAVQQASENTGKFGGGSVQNIYSSKSSDPDAEFYGTKGFEPYDASMELGADFKEKFNSAKKSGKEFHGDDSEISDTRRL